MGPIHEGQATAAASIRIQTIADHGAPMRFRERNNSNLEHETNGLEVERVIAKFLTDSRRFLGKV